MAINSTVINNTEKFVMVTIKLNFTGYLNSLYLEELEVKVDKCFSFNGSSGGSRASISSLQENKITIVHRSLFYYENKSPVENCIKRISLPGNLSITSIHISNPKVEVPTTAKTPATTTQITTNPKNDKLPQKSTNKLMPVSTTYFTNTLPTPTKPKNETEGSNDSPAVDNPEESQNIAKTIAVVFGILLFFIVVYFVIHQYRNKIVPRRAENTTTEMKQIDGSKTPWREIDKALIATEKELGSGFFGVVLQGTVILDGMSRQCAVKMLKENATEADNKDLINELHIIAHIGHHQNIINLIGACTQSGPALIVLEFASNGNLLEYLRQNRDQVYTNMTALRPDVKLDLRTRLKIAFEVAQGMRHLSSKNCVHRDLAARNILLDEHYVAKVTDFGLSRDVYEKGIYQINSQSKMPLKWMAIESLETTYFTTQSDVWSFGVLVWEIETGGATPYPGLMGREIFQELAIGHRLEQPPTCPDFLYEIMKSCWIRDPSERPSFEELCSLLDSFLQEEAGYEELSVLTSPNEASEITTNF